MALTATLVDQTGNTPVRREPPGGKFAGEVEINLDNSYPTNGYSLAVLATILGWNAITKFVPSCLGPTLTPAISDFSFDKANNKVKLFTSGAIEIANATDASALKLYGYAEGY